MKKIPSFLGLLAGALVLLGAAGCATVGSYTRLPEPMTGIERYHVLEVSPFRVSDEVTTDVSDIALADVREAFVKDFTNHRLMEQVVDTTIARDGVLGLRTTVAAWDPGSGFARWFIGFGLGAAKLTLHVALVDEANQSTLGETDVKFSYTGGMFGSGCDVRTMGKMMAPTVRKFVTKRGL